MHVKHLENRLILSVPKIWPIAIIFIIQRDVEKEDLTCRYTCPTMSDYSVSTQSKTFFFAPLPGPPF